MGSLRALILSIALGAQSSLAATQYVPHNNSLVIAASVHPCTLVGDPDLYGLGVRIAFYISFGTCLIAILFGLFDELKSPRLSFNVLLATLLIILVRNVHQGSFAIFEWYIVTGLVFISGSASLIRLPYEDDVEEEEQKQKPFQQEPIVHSNGSNDKPSEGKTRSEGTQTNDRMTVAGGQSPGVPGDNTADDSQVHDVEGKPGVKRADKERAFVERYAFERYRIYLSGPISFGFSYLLYGIFALMQPWLYFTHMDSGHTEGCPVPFVFFGTFDMYNVHWQRWLKAQAVLGVVASLGCLVIAIPLIFWGNSTRNYRVAALDELNKKMDKRIEKAEAEHGALKEELEKQKQQQRSEKQPEADKKKAKNTGQLGKDIEKLGDKVDQDVAKRQKLKKRQAQIREAVDKLGKNQRLHLWGLRGAVVILLAIFSGFLPIYFIERTLFLNHVDLVYGLADSSGQMLALLVAVFTSFGFVWQVLSNYTNGKKRRQDFKNTLVVIDDTIVDLTYALDKSIETNIKRLREFKSIQKMYRGLVSSLNFTKPSGSESQESSGWWRFDKPTKRGSRI
ncbi:hypothetical protein QBC44DRAFT_373736 [Cladorrhinum sp. PSN332]|nr:hypothetical protein QBC44DRAFT_373736 [Cladorrhinum sp. PSN332]